MIKILSGDEITARLYNSVENKFYGDIFRAVILSVNREYDKPYLVKRLDTGTVIALRRKEIKSIK